MRKLIVTFHIEEHQLDENGNAVAVFERELPHHNEIARWLPGEWDSLDPLRLFPKKVASCTLGVERDSAGHTCGVFTVTLREGARWDKHTRMVICEEIDAQLADGFGESYEYAQIPGAPEGYTMVIA